MALQKKYRRRIINFLSNYGQVTAVGVQGSDTDPDGLQVRYKGTLDNNELLEFCLLANRTASQYTVTASGKSFVITFR